MIKLEYLIKVLWLHCCYACTRLLNSYDLSLDLVMRYCECSPLLFRGVFFFKGKALGPEEVTKSVERDLKL